MNEVTGRADREKLIDRIAKLLALGSNNHSKNEAYAAMTKAQELMAKHLINESEVKRSGHTEKVVHVEVDETTSLVAWKSQLAYTIARNFRCEAVIYTRYKTVHLDDPSGRTKQRRVQVYTIIGLDTDAQIVKSIYTMAKTDAERLADEYCRWSYRNVQRHGIGDGIKMKNSWYEGFNTGLRDVFAEQVKRDNSMALMVVKPEAVMQHLSKLGLRPGKQSSANTGHRQAFGDGFANGRSFSPNQKIG